MSQQNGMLDNNPYYQYPYDQRARRLNQMEQNYMPQYIKCRPVVSIDEARAAQIDLGVWENTILNWCKRGYDTNYNPCRYKDEEQKAYVVKRTSSKAVLIDGVYYESLKAAAKALGVKDTSPLCKALKANRPYRGHKCEYANQQPS